MTWRRLFEFREIPDEPKPLLEHLEDLRGLILRVVAAVGVGMILSFAFRTQLAAIIQRPLAAVAPERATNLQSLGVADSFTISLQLSFYAGLILAFPAVLYFLALYVLPATTPRERRVLLPAAGTMSARCRAEDAEKSEEITAAPASRPVPPPCHPTGA
ncbi:MAG: twin-arginine translocase subunit TatC, partial [Terrimicrobiaceae bacterium]|nr:twin-arginine translocase subunit TatC [Terrimicrobiaceae bacterium]